MNWNAGDALLDCVASLRAASSAPVDVVVVDNASSDGSPDRLAAADPAVRLIRNSTNRGLAAANNQGLLAVSAPWVLISNPDVVYDRGAVDALVGAGERHERAGFVVPRLRHPDGELQTSAGELPTVTEALLGRAAQRRMALRTGEGTGFWRDGWAHDVECRIGRGHECAYLVRAAAVAEIGPQDERFVLDWEGVDWTARLRDAGWDVWFTPEAGAVHLGGVSLRQVPFRRLARSHLGMYRYFAKRRPLLAPVLAPVVAARFALKGVATAAGWTYERANRG